MNQQPFEVPPKWWAPKLSPFLVRLLRGQRLRKLRRGQKITRIDIQGTDHPRKLIESNAGVMITPNHSFHYDSYVMFEAAACVGHPFQFMAAWQVFAMSTWWERWMLQIHGVFSVDREGTDMRAIKHAVDIIKNGRHPLVIFPEGDIYHTNDRVTPFREGAAAIALLASRRSERPIYIVPAALKCWYNIDPTPRLNEIIEEIEARVFWKPRRDLSLKDRVYRVAEAVITLKEFEYLSESRTGTLSSRLRGLAETILSEMELRSGLKVSTTLIPERVKEVRRHHIQALQKDDVPRHERERLSKEMDDLFFVVQLFSYPGDYAQENPSVERLAEIIDKYEEDLLGLTYPTVKGERRVTLRFGEPLAVEPFSKLPDGTRALTVELEHRVQDMLDDLNTESEESKTKSSAVTNVI